MVITYTCRGRAPDSSSGVSVGPECGREISLCDKIGDRRCHAVARAKGWRLGTRADGTLDVLCPTCAAPDRSLVAACRELARSVRR